MQLHTYCRKPRGVIIVTKDTETLKVQFHLQPGNKLSTAVFHAVPVNGKYYNTGNHAYWLTD